MIKNYFLTQMTPFVGRKNELADVHARLLDPACRLLTVTGLGGSGKTRLAVEVAHAASAHFRDGVVFVNLQPLARSDLLVATIAGSAGFTFYGKDEPETQLLNYLREKSLLLLLDNFEHLPDGAMLISAILAHAPEVSILTTSREPLNLQEEWLYPLQGMSTPPSIYSTSLEDYEAVQLFLFHARRIQPGFDATREREAIIQICRLTEGLPLAIELVATWLSGLTASQVAVEIQQNLDFLSTRSRNVEERHRSIRAVFDQSWKLLSDAECQTFASLSVFRGGFDSQAAEKVAGATLATLSALVEKSLLRTGGSGRFDMHELVRQYGEEQLDHSGLATVTRQAHSTYYLDFLSRLAPDLKTVRQREALDAISLNFENVQAAWEWGVQTRQIPPLMAAVDSLFTFYELQSRLHEGDELLAAAAEALPGAPALRSRLLAHQASLKISLGQYEPARKLLNESVAIAQRNGGLAYSLNLLARTMCYLGDYAEAERLCQRSFSLYEEMADDRGKARCLHVSGFILSRVGNIREAQERYREAVTLFRALGDTHFLNASLINLGVMHYTLSEYSQARLILEESLDIASQVGNRLEIARALDHLGMLMVWGIKDYAAAESYYEQSLSLRREIGDVPGVAHVLNNMADIAAKRNDFARAHRLYSEALTLFQRQGDPWHTASALAGLGDAEAGLGQYDSALEYFRAALQKTVEIQAKVMTIAMFYSVALLFTKMGKKALAIALTGLIVHHPDSPPGLKDMARESVTATFPDIAPDDAAQMGVTVHRHLRELARILMLPQTYLNDLASIFADFLSEPLTRRELDILQLMAAGLTNPQIAAQLVISPGTVKTHTLNIYRKLDVANRTQAIARAREFNLLQP